METKQEAEGVPLAERLKHSALFLFDIDGTLLRGGTGVHRETFGHAYRTVYHLPLSLDGIPAGGRTDTWLLAEPLRRHGMADEEIWEKMPAAFESMQRFAEEYLRDLREYVLPGVPEVLTKLQAHGQLLGLLTGNLSRIAFAKLHHAGLDSYFGIGGFGEASEFRADLVPAALGHAGEITGRETRPGRAVVIGDTPFDIEAGKVHGTRTVGVATGTFSADELWSAGADIVFPSFADAEIAVERLMALSDLN